MYSHAKLRLYRTAPHRAFPADPKIMPDLPCFPLKACYGNVAYTNMVCNVKYKSANLTVGKHLYWLSCCVSSVSATIGATRATIAFTPS